MDPEELHGLIGRRILNANGRRLGRIVGITHHWDGGASALVSCWAGLRRSGVQVSLERATIVDGSVHLGHHDPELQVRVHYS